MRELKPAEKAFIEQLYREKYNRLCDYARKLLAGSAAAEDIVQDTFVMACAKIELLRQHPNPGGWLMLTLKQNVYNYWRLRDCLTNIIVDMPMEEWLDNYPDNQLPADDLDFLYGDLVKYKEYEILKKFAVEGYSTAEIAAEYGINVNTCKQRIFRAKKILMQALSDNKKTPK